MSAGAATPAGRRKTAARRAAPAPASRSPSRATRPKPKPPRARARGTARPPRGAAKPRVTAGPRRSLRIRLPHRPVARSTHRWRRRLVVLAVVAAALGIAYQAWFRDSSLVAVRDVKVEGVTSADRGQIVASLTAAARRMTTLDVKPELLATAAGAFPTIQSVTADPSFPHGMTLHVIERQAALVAQSGGHRVAVAADGTVLPGLPTSGGLPVISAPSLPTSGRLEGDALAQARVVGAAPTPLRPLVDHVAVSSRFGVVVALRGIQLRFGSGTHARSKWGAAAAVLADPQLHSASYVDLRVPGRPAVGGAG